MTNVVLLTSRLGTISLEISLYMQTTQPLDVKNWSGSWAQVKGETNPLYRIISSIKSLLHVNIFLLKSQFNCFQKTYIIRSRTWSFSPLYTWCLAGDITHNWALVPSAWLNPQRDWLLFGNRSMTLLKFTVWTLTGLTKRNKLTKIEYWPDVL